MQRKILSKYDEDLDGPLETVSLYEACRVRLTSSQGFRLGSSAKPAKAARILADTEAPTVNKALLSIDYLSLSIHLAIDTSPNLCAENLDTSDYLQEGDAGFKKQKKKKRPARRVVESDIVPQESTDQQDGMQVDDESKKVDTNFVDDDELQAALARSRKAKMRKAPNLTADEIAKRGLCTSRVVEKY